jgi:hypothetical protein
LIKESERMQRKSKTESERVIASQESDLSELFGISMDGKTTAKKKRS